MKINNFLLCSIIKWFRDVVSARSTINMPVLEWELTKVGEQRQQHKYLEIGASVKIFDETLYSFHTFMVDIDRIKGSLNVCKCSVKCLVHKIVETFYLKMCAH